MYRCRECGAFNRVQDGRVGRAVCGKCKQPLDLSGAPQEVDAEHLERAVASAPVPVLVDFWASWCGPCRMVAPVVETFAKDHKGRFVVLKVDTEANPHAANARGIQGIPTFVLYRDGAEVARQSGAMPLPMLNQFAEQA